MNQLFISPLFTMLSAHAGEMGSDTILLNDPYGMIVTIISVVVVMSALVALSLLIWLFSKAVIYSSKRQSEKTRLAELKTKGVSHDADADDNGEIIAAISLALKLNKEALHDKESEVITINSVARVYSPWSSKIHGLTHMPR